MLFPSGWRSTASIGTVLVPRLEGRGGPAVMEPVLQAALAGLGPRTCSTWWPTPLQAPSLHPLSPLSSQIPLVLLGRFLCPLSPNPSPRPLLTCSPARHLAATPWWTAPSAPTGLRSPAGPSEGDSRTTAAGRGGFARPYCLLCDTPRNRSPAQRAQKRQGGEEGSSEGLGAP